MIGAFQKCKVRHGPSCLIVFKRSIISRSAATLNVFIWIQEIWIQFYATHTELVHEPKAIMFRIVLLYLEHTTETPTIKNLRIGRTSDGFPVIPNHPLPSNELNDLAGNFCKLKAMYSYTSII